MISIIGIAVVVISIIGGFLMEKGQLMVLFQPAEFLIIGGAAFGTLLVSVPMRVLKSVISRVTGIMSPGPMKQDYLDLLTMMYELFNVARKDGLVGLESHIESPDKSSILIKYPKLTKNHHTLNFLVDTMRLIIMGGVPEHDLEGMMDLDLEVHHKEESQPAMTLARVGDALPGLGNCRRGTRRRDYHGRDRWSPGRDRRKSGRRAGRDFSWCSSLLRFCPASGRQYPIFHRCRK